MRQQPVHPDQALPDRGLPELLESALQRSMSLSGLASADCPSQPVGWSPTSTRALLHVEPLDLRQIHRHFAKRLHIRYSLIQDSPELQKQFGGIQGVPTTYLFDRNGVLRYKVVGFEHTEAVEKALQPLL